ncbi:MAG: ATP-binding cassette domain-containing protein, partial [Cypionkella sp.]|nr:ATP-binding cassette domain-containing protein [Cypionkella sp.]
MKPNLLEIKNLRIEATSYPPGEAPRKVVLVDDVSVSVEQGRVLGLIGESGAGKSTIGLSAMGFARGGARLAGGQILLNGRDIRSGGPSDLRSLRGREVTYVAQSAAAAFNPAKRLMEQVIEASLHHKLMTRAEAEALAVELFRKLGLPNPETFGSRYPHQVSGGQLQRAMTAMALCPKPDLVVFDEPTTALDVTTQIDVLVAIKAAIRDTGVAALYITHDLAVVAQVADDIIVLRGGKKVEYGTTDQIINAPQQAYTQALVSVRSIDHVEKADTASVLSVANITARYRGTNFDV